VVMTGRGRHLGTEVAWQLRCRPDGAFLEDIRGEHLSFSWGHPGGAASCWEARSRGHPHAPRGVRTGWGAATSLPPPGPVGQRCCAASVLTNWGGARAQVQAVDCPACTHARRLRHLGRRLPLFEAPVHGSVLGRGNGA